MIKVVRKELDTIEELNLLSENWENWGSDFEEFKKDKTKGQAFSWRQGIHEPLIVELSDQSQKHCTFCDSFPFDMSKETIEHFRPKNEHPLQAYEYRNLFYCCDKCQSKSNKAYVSNLKPDHEGYSFDKFFYVDLGTFKINVHEDLPQNEQVLANNFLERYGINDPERLTRRSGVYQDIKNYLIAKDNTNDQRQKDDFPYRYLFELAVKLNTSD